MKRPAVFLLLLMLALQACGGGTATPTEEPTLEAASTATESPTIDATEPPTEAALVPVDLAGPPMEVGSKYVFVDGTTLIAIPGGTFLMGDINSADNPEREITVSSFWLYSTKVTNGQYALCVASGKCSPPDPANAEQFANPAFTNFPVTGVNYDQASNYCSFVKGHLPTDAQWEKSARGPDGNIFPWGDQAPECSLLNFGFCEGKTTYINQYPEGKSFYDAWDMSGNVREWVFDWYDPHYNVENPIADPHGPDTGTERSVRSNSYQDSANAAIAANRFSLDPSLNQPDLGFRCAVNEENPATLFAPWCQSIAFAGIAPDGTDTGCTPQIVCNDVSLSISSECGSDNVPFSVVSFQLNQHPPNDWTFDVPGCQNLNSTPLKAKFLCEVPGSAGPATVAGSCQDVVTCATACPAHYVDTGEGCVWDGSSTGATECLPGSTFDPLTQCCTVTDPNQATQVSCPAGYFSVNGVCYQVPHGVPEHIVQEVGFNSCTPPATANPDDQGNDNGEESSGGGGGACPAPQTLVCTVTPRGQICSCQ